MLFKEVDNFSFKQNFIIFKDTYLYAKEIFIEMIFGIDFHVLSIIIGEKDK